MTDHRKLEELRHQAFKHAQTAFVRTERRHRLQHALESLYALLLEVSFGSTALLSPALTSPALTSPALTSPALTSPALTSPALRREES